MSRSEREKKIDRWMDQLSSHKVSERKSISWHLNAVRTGWEWKPVAGGQNSVRKREHYQSAYAYAVTWTPGTLTLSGDLGEFTITHWNAMPTVEEAITFVARADFSYLMSKSNVKEEYDADLTAAFILETANQNVSARDLLKEERRYRKERLRALCHWDCDETMWAAGVAEGHATEESRPLLEDYLPDPDSFDRWTTLKCWKRKKTGLSWPFLEKIVTEAPDGWELWLSLYEHYEPDDRGMGPDCIFHAWARMELRESLRNDLQDRGAESATRDVIQALGIDDYYGSYAYNDHCYLWYAALQTWAEKVKPLYPALNKETA